MGGWVEQSRGQTGESTRAPSWQHSIQRPGLLGVGSAFLSHLDIPNRPPTKFLTCHSLSFLGLGTCSSFLSRRLYPFLPPL